MIKKVFKTIRSKDNGPKISREKLDRISEVEYKLINDY